MDSLSQQQAVAKCPPATGRKRGTACERCNRRRSRCDGWIIGVPCTACRKSNNHAQCTLIQSKRWRGPDGRYTMRTGGEPQLNTADINAESTDLTRASSLPLIAHQAQNISQNESIGSSSPPDGDDGREKEKSPSSTQSLTGGSVVVAKRPRAQPIVQPNFVGESWYASYVMRGYAPGHTSFHRSIDECNRTVQSISRDAPKNSNPSIASSPRDVGNLSDLPPPGLVDRLIKVYFDRFHAFCPILRKNVFYATYRDDRLSGTLLRSVLFVASLHCDLETVHLLGYSTRLDANLDLFGKASASFDEDQESDRTNMVLSSYLLHYWFGNPTTYRDAHWWLAAAIRSAQCMGYHRSTKNSQLPPVEKSRWKRIWWCLYIRDRQTSLSTGTPMVINDLDHDVEELVLEDLPDETPETAHYIIQQMELNKAAARLYFLHCSPSRLPLSSDPSVREEAMQDIQMTLRAWYTASQGFRSSNPSHHLVLTMDVCYNYYLINLHQRLQRQSHKFVETKCVVDAALRVFSLVDDSLLYWTPEHFPMIYVSALFSAMMALAANGESSPPRSDDVLRKIRPGLLALKQFEPVYILARWIRNLFMDILKRSESPPGEEAQASQGIIEISRETEGQPITPDSVPYVPTTTAAACTVTPLATDQPDYPTPSLMVEDSDFMMPGNVHGDARPPNVGMRGMGGFWSTSLMNGVFSSNHDTEMMDFPQPDSLQYQALYFLADLGIANTDSV